ncbi:MAG: glycoside hydrolase [Novosphingobium sp.]|nr:glycoside hydrolase [Novosphingobium sp.]
MVSARRVARDLAIALLAGACLPTMPLLAQDSAPTAADPLREQFRDPPDTARPRVWWHWLNGNVTKDGIAKDLEWMKRVGIGGVQNFDASLRTPQIVERRLAYMTPEWKDAFRFATGEAERLGLEFAIAASPGWSETGGPWVKPADGMKKLVWSETEIEGGAPVAVNLPAPPGVTGPYQSVAASSGMSAAGGADSVPETAYRDVSVLAYRIEPGPDLPEALYYDGANEPLAAGEITDGDFGTTIALSAPQPDSDLALVQVFADPVTMRSATFFAPGQAFKFIGSMISAELQAISNGKDWSKVADLPVASVPTTVSFDAVTAQYFRVVIKPKQPTLVGGAGGVGAPGSVAPDYYAQLLGVSKERSVRIAEWRLSPDARVDRAEAKAGFAVAPDYGSLSGPLPDSEGIAPENIVDVTARMSADGRLTWTPPPGRWKILRMGWSLVGTKNHPASAEATGLEVDKYDGDAVRRYMETYLGMYADALGGKDGLKGAIDAILTDSIEVDPSNWTPGLIDKFRKLRGYDPTPWLPALTGTIVGSRKRSDAFLYDFRRTLSDLIASEHYGTVAKVAHEKGLIVYGEALENGRPVLGSDIAMRRHADIPMAAMWTYDRGKEPDANYLADIKGAASTANIYGRKLVAAESLTSRLAPWAHSPADLKHVIDMEFVTGVNRPVIHTSVHQPLDDKVPGLSLFMFGQYFNRHETWAGMARPWVDYIARNSLMLQQGRSVADFAYFIGEDEPLTSMFRSKYASDTPAANNWDFIDAEALTGALRVEGGWIVTDGGAQYPALYLGGSSRSMTLPVLRKIAQLAEAGATVIGTAPVQDPSLAGDDIEYVSLVAKLWLGDGGASVGKGRVIAARDIDAALQAIGIRPDFRAEKASRNADIRFMHRTLADGDSYFLVNRGGAEQIDAHFRVTGKVPELWHADSGKTELVSYRIAEGETIVPLSLAAGEAVHVVFRRPADGSGERYGQPVASELGRIEGSWTVRFEPGRGAPEFTVLPGLQPLDRSNDDGIRHFSGIATYEKLFNSPAGWQPGQALWIDLGEVHEIAEVIVNGEKAGITWHAPYRVDIGSVTKQGLNRIEVRVANLWVNRLIGDAQPDAQKITWTSMPSYRADAPLRRSGLIGPVRLMTGE